MQNRNIGKNTLVLLLGILYVFLCYYFFYFQAYFYPPAYFSLAAMFILGTLFIFLPVYYRGEKFWEGKLRVREKLALSLSSAPAIFLFVFGLAEHGGYSALLYPLLLFPFVYIPIIIAAAIPVAFIYAYRKDIIGAKSLRSYAKLAVLIVLVSVVSFYLLSYALGNTGWKGTDEAAFDYYAAHLFSTGSNPYVSDMNPALLSFNLFPTLLLNGTCECRYTYPPLSFLPFAVLTPLSIDSIYPFVLAAVLLTVIASFFLFRKSKGKYAVLLLVLEFLLLAYINRPSAYSKYLAVSVLLLLAYAERRKPCLQGTLLGLAAATHQLAWLAIPFFYLLSIRESGIREFSKVLFASACAFLAVCAYFIALSPQAMMGSLTYLFGAKFEIQGPTFIGILSFFHQVPYFYSGAVMLMLYLTSLLLFYFYTRTLRPLLAVAPWAIFFMSWFNESGYFLAFVPLLIYICVVEDSKASDRLKDKRCLLSAILLAVSVAALLFVYPGALA